MQTVLSSQDNSYVEDYLTALLRVHYLQKRRRFQAYLLHVRLITKLFKNKLNDCLAITTIFGVTSSSGKSN